MWSVIVVGYRTAALLPALAASVRRVLAGVDHEIVYVDNSEEPPPAEAAASDLTYLSPGRNLGFGAACNLGVRHARGETLFFLNPDCSLDAAGDLSAVAGDPECIWLPYVRESQLGEGYGGYLNRFPFLSTTFRRGGRESRPGWFRGSALILPRAVHDRLGGWDERYFMYAEDMDLFWTAHEKGIRVRRVPLFVTHEGGGSTATTWGTFQRERMVQRAMLLFFKKVRAPWSAVAWYPLVLASALLRAPRDGWAKLPAYVLEAARSLRSGGR